MPLRLYISHASEDQARVNQLRDELTAKEFQVFLCEDLPPGSDWQKEMDRELRQADVFVYCLSSASVARPGSYNDELKAARSRYRTEGENAILIAPVRLEPCMIPADVKDLMVLDLFLGDGLKRLVEFLQSRASAGSHHVFLLHGIKTRGKWQKDFSPLLGARNLIPVPLDFGHFRARHLLWPWARKRKQKWLLDEYQRQCVRLGCKCPSIVAHSFGCYLVASLLKKYSDVRFDRIIFCGSIVHPSYPWVEVVAHGQVKSILNQYGGADFWAWIVQWVVANAGPSGYSGFAIADAAVLQQNHPEFEHSDYFYDLNYHQNWMPFLLGQPLPAVISGPNQRQVPANWRFRFVVCIVALLLVGLAAFALERWLVAANQVSPPARQAFSGFVQDDRGDPIPSVTIIAPTLGIPPQTTDASGRFSFQVDLPAGTNFRLIAKKPGFETRSADPPSGDTTFNITLHQDPGSGRQ